MQDGVNNKCINTAVSGPQGKKYTTGVKTKSLPYTTKNIRILLANITFYEQILYARFSTTQQVVDKNFQGIQIKLA